MIPRLNSKKLSAFIAARSAENDAFGLLRGLADWLRRGGAKRAAANVALLRQVLSDDADLCGRTATMLCRWLGSVRLYPLFISAGIFAREGFRRELTDRVYERINPSFKDKRDLRDVFALLFCDERDTRWLDAVPEAEWAELFALLRSACSESERDTLHRYLREEGLYAVEMLAVWMAAEGLEPDLIRLDNKLLNVDSPFVALKREVMHWVEARTANRPFDDGHLYVMLDQSSKQVENLRKKGTGAGAGSSMNVAHLLERLDQTLKRMMLLMDTFSPNRLPPARMLKLANTLAMAAADQHSIRHLWSRSVKMLSRSITQNTGNHGEHYITRNKKEYLGMFYSAAGGGVLIALMSLFKIHLATVIANPFWLSVAQGLNYGLGFALIFILHFTVATKQPAMTASTIAAVVEENDKGRALDMRLAQLLVDVLRSQSVAVFGNMFLAVSVAMLIALGYRWQTGTPLLNDTEVHYQLAAVHPFAATLWYAAIAGVWLFCSGIISGFFDNRCDYLNLRMRLRHHPLLKYLLPEKIRARFADYWHHNYGSLMGNLCFGMLLGMTGWVGHATGLPLDIRHVAFSSANVGYAAVSGSIGFWLFWQSIVFAFLIGLVNLLVSFSITLNVALRSRETKIDSWWGIVKCLWHIVRANPRSLILPPEAEKQPESPPGSDTEEPSSGSH